MKHDVLRSSLSALAAGRRPDSPATVCTDRILAAARAAARARLAELAEAPETAATLAERERLAARLGSDPQSPTAAPSLRDSDPPE